MVNQKVLAKKIEFLRDYLMRVELYEKISFKEFLFDRTVQDVVEFNLFHAVNIVIAMMEHIVVDEKYGLPQSASDAAEMLVRKKVLSQADAVLLRQMIGFRNIIAHQYTEIDKKKSYAALTRGVKDIRRIVKKIALKFKF